MVLIDGFVRTEVRFKYIADGQACFEQFGTDVLLCYPMDQYGRTWSLEENGAVVAKEPIAHAPIGNCVRGNTVAKCDTTI